MEVYTLDNNFAPVDLVEGYSSAIWTERFFTAGDVQISCPAEPWFSQLLAPGVKLGHHKSREVMVIEDHDLEDGKLKVTGRTLEAVIGETRMIWLPAYEYRITETVGYVLGYLAERFLIRPQDVDMANYTGPQLDWVREAVPNLELGQISIKGEKRPREFSSGDFYSLMQPFLQANGMGFRIFLDEVTEDGYTLKIAGWYGKDRTSNQNVRSLVRLSPQQNSLMNTKEFLSIKSYRNVVYVRFQGEIHTFYAEPTLPIPVGLDRRTMVLEAEGTVPDGDVEKFLRQRAADAFANNNYVRAIDGEATIPSEYVFGRDYGLGDIIELEGLTGLLTKARVTEYIRAEDAEGDREYPTIAVVDPLDTGNLPTTDGNDGDDGDDGDGIDPPDDGWPDEGENEGPDPEGDEGDDPQGPDGDDPDPNNPPSEGDKNKGKGALPPANQPDPDPDPDTDPDPNGSGSDPDPDPGSDQPPLPPGPLTYLKTLSRTIYNQWNAGHLEIPGQVRPSKVIGTFTLPHENAEYYARTVWTIGYSVPEYEVYRDWLDTILGEEFMNTATVLEDPVESMALMIARSQDPQLAFYLSYPGLWATPEDQAIRRSLVYYLTDLQGFGFSNITAAANKTRVAQQSDPAYLSTHTKLPSVVQNRSYAVGYRQAPYLFTPDVRVGPQVDRLTKLITASGADPQPGEYEIELNVGATRLVYDNDNHGFVIASPFDRWNGSVNIELYYRMKS